jgi:hypothetical protein
MTIQDKIWFEKLYESRNTIANTLKDSFAIGNIWNSVVEKYSDQAHFIYELLQNADDVLATKAYFNLAVDGRLTDDLIYQSVKKGTELNIAIDETLKGKEMKMPAGLSFTDKDGTVRTEIRIKWWEDPSLMTYKSISVLPIDNLPQQPIRLSELKSSDYYTEHDKSVFFGHYWLKGKPFVYKKNICCLDYSVAKGGNLVAYSMNGESVLEPKNFTFV